MTVLIFSFSIFSMMSWNLYAIPPQFSQWESKCREIRETTSHYCDADGCDITDPTGVPIVAKAFRDSQSIRDETFSESKKLLHAKMSPQEMNEFLAINSRDCVLTLPRHWWRGIMATNHPVAKDVKEDFMEYLRDQSLSLRETMTAMELAKEAVETDFVTVKNKEEVLERLREIVRSLGLRYKAADQRFKEKVEGAGFWQKTKIKLRQGWALLKGDFDTQMFWSEDYGLFLMEQEKLAQEGKEKLRDLFPESKK